MIVGLDTEQVNAHCREYGLNPDHIPQHVAIIMDGNGRWAKARSMPRTYGHKQGADSLKGALRACSEFGVHYLTVYAFSTENWKRPETEVSFLMNLMGQLIEQQIPEFMKNGVRIRFLGDRDRLPKSLLKAIQQAETKTRDNAVVQLNVMVNYGSRHELTQAVQTVVAHHVKNPETAITEDVISQALYTRDMPDPDVLIRTGGEHRISNFLLWQLAYTELFFLDTLWPDFSTLHLAEVLRQFQARDRRFGGVK